jgi:hypothetical protein
MEGLHIDGIGTTLFGPKYIPPFTGNSLRRKPESGDGCELRHFSSRISMPASKDAVALRARFQDLGVSVPL